MKSLTDDQKELIRDFMENDEGTSGDETPGEAIKKLLNLSDEDYLELEDEIEERMLAFFGDIKVSSMDVSSKKCQSSLIIDKELVHNEKWQTPLGVAKQEYRKLLLLLVGDKDVICSKFVSDFLRICGSKNMNEFSGRVSLGEAFDEAAIILKVEFKKEDKLKRLEIVYNEVGLASFAAIA